MTTSDEAIQLIVYLVHLGVIGAECTAGDTLRRIVNTEHLTYERLVA